LCAYAIAPHRPIQAQSACLRHSVALHDIQDRILAQSKTMTDLPIGLTFATRDRCSQARLSPLLPIPLRNEHTRRAKPTSDGVFEIVDANVPEARWCRFAVLLLPVIRRAFPSRSPGRVVDLGHGPRFHCPMSSGDPLDMQQSPGHSGVSMEHLTDSLL
jgi:hypothetical protein